VPPVRWVIVSDGSTDDTDAIVGRYAADHPYIELVRRDAPRRRSFSSKAYAIHEGMSRLRGLQYDYIGNLDADISFGPDYFEQLVARMDAAPVLGVSGGHQREQVGGAWTPQVIAFDWSVTGGVQFFRRDCFEAVGGYIPTDWGLEDAIAEIMVRMQGYRVKTFRDISVLHHRRVATEGKGILAARFWQGRKEFAQGVHPCFQAAKCVRRVVEPPWFIGSVLRCAGFWWAVLRREPRAVSPEVIAHLREEELARLAALLRVRRAPAEQDAPSPW